VPESSASLTGESHADATDADASVLGELPTFTSWLGWAGATRLRVLLLLHGKIPHKPGVATVLGQCCRLLNARKQPKPAHIKT
jgi:hypothetical protein